MKRFILILITLFILPMTANANVAPLVPQANIEDLNLFDRMIIMDTNWDSEYILNVNERIGTQTYSSDPSNLIRPDLITYPNYYNSDSAIVTSGTPDNFFDSLVTWGYVSASPSSSIMKINFTVLNDSLFKWSDFHFEFLSADDLSPTTLKVKQASNSSNDFNLSDFGSYGYYSSINFWTDTQDLLTSGETTTFEFEFDLRYFNGQTSFVIRQAATTPSVPVPGALVLLGSGLLYLVGIRRK